jgi:CTP:molybdopterin cytidylyltransferase MocA
MIAASSLSVILLAGGRAMRMQGLTHQKPVIKPALKFPSSSAYSVMQAACRTAIRRGYRVCVVTDERNVRAVERDIQAVSGNDDDVLMALDEGTGTAGAIAVGARSLETDYVVTMNTDTFVPVDVLHLARHIRPAAITAFLTPRSIQNEALIGLRPDGFHEGRVEYWGEGAAQTAVTPTSLTACSATGAYVMHRIFAATIDERAQSFEREVLPAAVERGDVDGHRALAGLPTYDFGTISRYYDLLGDRLLQQRLMRASGLDFWERI